MLRWKMMKHDVIDAILDTWADISYSEVVDQSLREYSPHPEEQDAKRLFLGHKWGEITDEVLSSDVPNPFLIGSTALRYYLPAFLICAIRKKRWCELLEYLADIKLRVPRKENALERFKEDFDPLSQAQRFAVMRFLQYASSFYEDDSRVKARIKDSIERYWGRSDC
ncbi:MAG: DUF6714 family protein [Pirellulales bacterium]